MTTEEIKAKLKAILEDTPSYDPELGLTANTVGGVLNGLIASLEELTQES